MKIPNKIYLQVKDEFGNELEEVTWCQDQINDTDLEYVLVVKSRLTQDAPDKWNVTAKDE